MRRKRLPSLKERSEAMKKRLAARKEKIMEKLKGTRPSEGAKELATVWAVFGVWVGLCGMAICCCGCALERSDPAARSNRATITLSVVAHGDNSTATGYITDGLLATADGEGAITQPSTQTAEQSPEFSGGIDPVTAGINAAAHLGGKAIDAYTAKSAGGSGQAASGDGRAASGLSCPDGNCSASSCPDGNCTPTVEAQ